MGPQQLGLLHQYAKAQSLKGNTEFVDAFQALANQGVIGLSNVEPEGFIVVDSACSATQIALGAPARSETVGLNADGDPRPTILELAKFKGLKTGLVSDTRITHATPAAFAAHVAHRDEEADIATEMLEVGPDVLLSGGVQFFIGKTSDPKEFKNIPFPIHSKRNDDLNLLKRAQETLGYSLVFDRKTLQTHQGGKLLGLFSNSAMPTALWQNQHGKDPERTVPSLKEMTEAALRTLDHDSDEGFFLMVEAGQIDWAGHNNDAGDLLHEMLQANEALAYILDWAKKDGSTLVVATADHETGGFGFSYSAFEPPSPMTLTGLKFKNRPLLFDKNFQDYSHIDLLYQQTEGFQDFWAQFEALPKAQQTTSSLQSQIKEVFGVTVSRSEAAQILKREPNAYFTPSLYRPTEKEWTEIHDFDAYYYNKMTRQNGALARSLAIQQGIVWSTGSHTSTPVAVLAFGPGHSAQRFGKYFTHVELGQALRKSLGL